MESYAQKQLLRKVLLILLLVVGVVCFYFKFIQRDQQGHNKDIRHTGEVRERYVNIGANTRKHFDFIQDLKFLPYTEIGCKDLYKEPIESYLSEKYLKAEEALNAYLKSLQIKERMEGHSQQFRSEQITYWKLANLPFVHTVCETGFNAGHSALLWLHSKEDLVLYSFDMAYHNYSKKMAEYIHQAFPERFQITWGDSMDTVPKFHEENKDLKCDLLIVDGGHTEDIASADLANFQKMASDLNFVVLDDYPAVQGFNGRLAPAWERNKRNGTITEFFRCKWNNARGFVIGQYL